MNVLFLQNDEHFTEKNRKTSKPNKKLQKTYNKVNLEKTERDIHNTKVQHSYIKYSYTKSRFYYTLFFVSYPPPCFFLWHGGFFWCFLSFLVSVVFKLRYVALQWAFTDLNCFTFTLPQITNVAIHPSGSLWSFIRTSQKQF